MITPLARRGLVGAALLSACALTVVGCSSGTEAGSAAEQSSSNGSTSAPEPSSEAGSGSGSGEMFGCTDEMMAYFNEYGYPEAEPLDPATLEIPEVSFSVTPDCYIVDQYSGAVRYGATWSSDPNGVLTQLGEALTAAGYVQSDDYGPLVWWIDGEDPLTAAHAIAAAPQPIGGVETLWATW